MPEWLTAQIAAGFPALKGAALSGSIPIKEELINDLIADFLARPPAAPGPPGGFDPRVLLPLVKRATVHADQGVVTLNVEVQV
jgi:hypothetical protein